ncbi:MAG: hypothetical protein IPK57_02770 [Chitinophagaceae bacterium]|nr:hypothetical protein [Chitinophagaceae bacterium]
MVSFTALPDTVMDMSSELLLQELNINSRESIFEPKDGIRLKPDENNLFLRFTVIDYESSDGYQFSYKLNEEEDWQSSGQSAHAGSF